MSRCSIYGYLMISIVFALIARHCAIDAQPIEASTLTSSSSNSNESRERRASYVADDLSTDATLWRNYYGYRPFVGGRAAYLGYGGPVYRTGAFYQPDVVFNVLGGAGRAGYYRGYGARGGYPRFGGYGWAGYI